MVKRVLMVAFHFPPLNGGSGIQRTLKFASYLPQFGWAPVVLSAHRRAFAASGDDQMADIPADVPVHRAFALDTSRHLAFKGRYPGWLALPDRWVSWLAGAIPAGLRLIRQQRPDVIWSTYPIASAHLIGLVLHRLSGIPWVADMRDPMSDNYYPLDPFLHRVFRRIEDMVINRCSAVVCTTAGAVTAYRARFPHLPADHFTLIENGYDEADFARAEQGLAPPAPSARFRLLHSGVIYPLERDPIPLFQALAALQQQGALAPANFELVLRASGHDDFIAGQLREYGIGDLVTLAPPLPYRAALADMLGADALLLLQAANCNHQVPAKLYEYLRARRPILACTDAAGETASALREAGIDTIVALDSKNEIMRVLIGFLAAVKARIAPIASAATIAAHSRQSRTAQLGVVMDQLVKSIPESNK